LFLTVLDLVVDPVLDVVVDPVLDAASTLLGGGSYARN